jgi:hypothetical protein
MFVQQLFKDLMKTITTCDSDILFLAEMQKKISASHSAHLLTLVDN